MRQAEGYAEKSRLFFRQAQEELVAGDLDQASEKLWGAAAQMVKAVAERRGWPHDSHQRLYRAVRQRGDETGDRELTRLFQTAGSLHFNFYEGTLPREYIEDTVAVVQELMEKLETL